MQDAKAFGPTAGALFWSWFAQGQRAPAEEGGNPGGLFGIYDTESTWATVQDFTATMSQLSSFSFGGTCPAPKAGGTSGAAGPPPDDCAASWVGGKEGTGFEGPGCSIDINECARGTADCDINAACANTLGGYNCSCFPGYSGDGSRCTATPSLAAVQATYFTRGPGAVAWKEGTDVQYPPNAPGWAYDPTESLDRHKDSPWKGGLGSRVPVEPEQCMLACSVAPGCDSFAYNGEQKRCFLKSGVSSDTCQASRHICAIWPFGIFYGATYKFVVSILFLQKPETLCVSARGQPYSCGAWQTYFNSTAIGEKVQASEGPPDGAVRVQSWLTRAVAKEKERRESQREAEHGAHLKGEQMTSPP